MSTVAISSGAARRSTLNPNAPLFIPAAFQQVEDFSPEWWELVKNTTWFRDHWFRQHQGEENFDGGDHDDEGDDYDVTNLLPESFDLELSALESEFDAFEAEQEAFDAAFSEEKLKAGHGGDANNVMRTLNLMSPKNGGGVRALHDSAKHRDKPSQYVSPKNSPRRIIQQPR
ncbi:Protein EARLY RESPONSIVE TO DEHYDRATION 15 [Ananas comosus]|uniref:Protein EARLY RESPONSIVE TO DEHYDRATION 15 n=1 Tax=Ananas comosus TaxID=4615 RepID=A0A199UXJ7_ANACO|nr:Protein EARLY RESPONSIVE TO DEHYDRATION 15 [Ananas comosus]